MTTPIFFVRVRTEEGLEAAGAPADLAARAKEFISQRAIGGTGVPEGAPQGTQPAAVTLPLRDACPVFAIDGVSKAVTEYYVLTLAGKLEWIDSRLFEYVRR